MSGNLEETIAQVRDRVTPSDEERAALEQTVEVLLERTESAVVEQGIDADVLRVGSTARDTWLRGDRDIDIFVRFDSDYSRADLTQHGIEIGQSVLPDGRLEYAEHPYVTADFQGYSVDLVPCFRVERGAEIRSAVDRTPFHAEYVQDHLDETLAGDVRILKRFCEAIGIYGSDLRTEGFSGFLTELLVLEFGSVIAVLEVAADWHPPISLDPAGHGTVEFADPLVVIDPTDPTRNVAAVVSAENVARFQHHAREVLSRPSPARFRVASPDPLTQESLREHLSRRQTTPMAIRFPAPDLLEDQLYPQLRTSLDGLKRALNDREFSVLRGAIFAHDTAVLYLELSVTERPGVERHEGPPVHVRDHAEAFLDTYADAEVYGPFIDGDRYIVEREREVRRAETYLNSDRLLDVGLGKDIRQCLAEEYDVLSGAEVLALLPEFGRELATYYAPSP